MENDDDGGDDCNEGKYYCSDGNGSWDEWMHHGVLYDLLWLIIIVIGWVIMMLMAMGFYIYKCGWWCTSDGYDHMVCLRMILIMRTIYMKQRINK